MTVNLLAIEMSVVERPFVLDFASAHLDDETPVFPDEVMEEWHERKRKEFGSKNWPKARGILAVLRRYGIHMTDVHLGNIGFVDTDQSSSSS